MGPLCHSKREYVVLLVQQGVVQLELLGLTVLEELAATCGNRA